MRRIIAKRPDTINRVKGIIQAYSDQGIMGICDGPLQVEPPTCPPPTYGGRALWTNQARSMGGPVGLFCASLAEHKAAITTSLVIHSWPTFCFHLLYAPSKPAVL